MLRHVPGIDDPRVLVDAATRDDAAVFRLSKERAIVATVDFFAPIVDDAHAFGAIAAANALSDLYAMGASPLFVLSLVAWPRDPEMLALLEVALQGQVQKIEEAGALLLGGHSVDDQEPKLGLVAIGDVAPNRLWSNAGARPGDTLVLTKPLGTGILSTALKRDAVDAEALVPATEVMATLNAGAARAVAAVGDAVHAVTDVTGFGLLGHLRNVAEASGVSARVVASQLPALAGALGLIEQGVVPGGTTRNLEAASAFTRWEASVSPALRTLAADAQTSGGLLIAVAPDAVERLVEGLQREDTPAAAIIGEVLPQADDTIVVTGG